MSRNLVVFLMLLGLGALGCWHGQTGKQSEWAEWPKGLQVERQTPGNRVDEEYRRVGGEAGPVEVRVMHKALEDFRRIYRFTPGINEGCPGVPSFLEVHFARKGDRYFATVGFDVTRCGAILLMSESPTWEFDAKGRQVKP